MKPKLAVVAETAMVDPYEGDLGEVSLAEFQRRASKVGREFKHETRDVLIGAGAQFLQDPHKTGEHYPTEGVVCGRNQQPFLVLAHGRFDDGPDAGLRRSDTVKKLGHDVHQIHRNRRISILVITSHLPAPGSAAAAHLANCAADIYDVIALNEDLAGHQRLHRYLHDSPFPGRLPAPWRDSPSVWIPELFDLEAPAGPLLGTSGPDAGTGEEVAF